MQKPLPNSALRFVLEALVPYTEANMKLAFKPSQFFNDLERIGQTTYAQSTLRQAYFKAKRDGLIATTHGTVVLADRSVDALKPYIPQKLPHSCVLLTFDIPEPLRHKRRLLRALLREHHFARVQQSVWCSEYDCVQRITKDIRDAGIAQYINVYEAVKLS